MRLLLNLVTLSLLSSHAASFVFHQSPVFIQNFPSALISKVGTAALPVRAHGLSRFGLPSITVQKRKALSLRMGNGFEGDVSITSARNFGETFFFKMEYSGEAFNAPKLWNFRRTWNDFVSPQFHQSDLAAEQHIYISKT
jgi:hypothetical protein